MALLKKVVLALFVSTAMIATAPAALAAPAGKVKNQTAAETAEALDASIKAAEDALAGIQSGADKNAVMDLLKASKQTAKTVESSVVLVDRDRALSSVNKARNAYKKGDTKKAEALMVEAVEKFKAVKSKFHSF